MNQVLIGARWLCSTSGLGACVLITVATAQAQVLYDAAVGTLPDAQGWSYLNLGGTPAALTNESVFIDTSSAAGIQAGWAELAPVPLNRTNGFTVLFTLQLESESHTTDNRAGLSVIVLGEDRRGIELGFWTGTVSPKPIRLSSPTRKTRHSRRQGPSSSTP